MDEAKIGETRLAFAPFKSGAVAQYIIQEKIQELLQSGRIERSKNIRFAAPVFLHAVKKKGVEIPLQWSSVKKLEIGENAPSGWKGKSLKELAEEVKRLYNLRLIYDYRQINSITEKDLTRMDDILSF